MDKALPCNKLVLKAMRETIPHTFLLLDKIKRLNDLGVELDDEGFHHEQVLEIEKAVYDLKASVGHTILKIYNSQFDDEGDEIEEEDENPRD